MPHPWEWGGDQAGRAEQAAGSFEEEAAKKGFDPAAFNLFKSAMQ